MVNLICIGAVGFFASSVFLSLFDGFTGKAGKSKPNFRIDDYCCCRWRSRYSGYWICDWNSRCDRRCFCYFSLCVLFDLLCFWSENSKDIVFNFVVGIWHTVKKCNFLRSSQRTVSHCLLASFDTYFHLLCIKSDGFIVEKSFYVSAGYHFGSRQRI